MLRGARCVTSLNYLCDLNVGDKVEVTGPFGVSFLMPTIPEKRDRHDLHRHRKRTDAGDDRVAAALAQVGQV